MRNELHGRATSARHRRTFRITGALGACAALLGTVGMVGVGVENAHAAPPCTGSAIDSSTLTLPAVAAAVGAPVAWATGSTGAGIDVAVIDTGIDAVPGLASTGKISDAVDLSFDAPQTNLRYRDVFGHGTAMAGIIAGDGTGGPMTRGVAPGARLVNVKVGAGDGAVDASQVIAALDWITQNRTASGRNIRVINLSFDTDSTANHLTDPLAHAVQNAWKAGIVVVVSGGNDGKSSGGLGNPAIDPYVIAVGGSSFDPATLKFQAAKWSSIGDGVRNPDFLSPGALVAGLRVPGSFLDTMYPAARFVDPVTCLVLFRGSGTSQAAAATSGAVALLLQQRPTLTPDQVKRLFTDTAIPRAGNVNVNGAGLINLVGALVAPAPTAVQSYTRSTGTGSLEGSRGTMHIGTSPDVLTGEYQAFKSAFNAKTWAPASDKRAAWTNQTFDAAGRMLSGTWMGSSWTGSSWTGSSWTGSSWTGSSWTGSSWTGSSWTGSSWTGSSWTGSSWTGSSWSGSSWSGVGWR